MRTLTRRELARYNGKDGAPAYFAYEGKVYDASRSFLWQRGRLKSSTRQAWTTLAVSRMRRTEQICLHGVQSLGYWLTTASRPLLPEPPRAMAAC